ncbi:MAG TPA: AAA family ATPase [Kofleriaceae bacterium]|jgi:SpoVK/Ycf46/Vps4 family AAA+-type ATPase
MHEVGDLARAYVARYLAMRAHKRPVSSGSAFGPNVDEITRTLAEGTPRVPEIVPEAPSAEVAAADAKLATAAAAFEHALAQKPEPRLARLIRVFGLQPLDAVIIALLFAPELDHELERAYTFAVDDFTRKRGDVGFFSRVISARDPRVADLVLLRFDDAAPLRRHAIVTLAAGTDVPATMRPVRLADRIVGFLRGHDNVDELVHGYVRLQGRAPKRAELVMRPDLIEQVSRALDGRAGVPRVLLAGPEGAGRALVAEIVLAEQGRGSVRIDLAALRDDPKAHDRLEAALREAALRDAAAILDGGSVIDREVPRNFALAVGDAISDVRVPVVFTLIGHPTWLVENVPSLLELDIPPPTFRERLVLWARMLPQPLASAEDIEIVASRYAFTAATIARAANRAGQHARLREPNAPRVTLDDLGDAARMMFSHRLGAMAQRIPTGFSWDDLVLPKDTLEGVKEVVRFARYRPFLLEDWGFAAKLPYGRGISAILAGPPGTGKTMVAQLLAKELGYDLYRVDLSQVVNKYIGETEKNLAKIFDEAENSHAVLFFDEADSLFAKRTDVKSSNDRYANLEVNYLLQRMETFDGVTLLATNLEQGLDEAFKRRVRFSVAFELPEEAERRRLWVSMFPAKVPLEEDIDWDKIAHAFEMAGGYIKKAALRAALFAADKKRPISTADIYEAARQEYREMGRII